MLSAEDLAAVRTAIELCNRSELKKEILCASGSECDRNMTRSIYRRKAKWNEIVENKATVILENLRLVKQLREKITGLVLLIGKRMLTWAEYHKVTFDLSRDFTINCLNSSFFTSHGIIDNKKVAEELIKDKSLSIRQKYKLACIYCFKEHIPVLYRQMSKEDKEEFYDGQSRQKIKQSELVTFWSYHLRGQTVKLTGESTLDEFMLERAVGSGSKAAVEYCLEETSLSRMKDSVINAALETVRTKTKGQINDDRFVFESNRFRFYMAESWIPNDYYTDILSFLLSKMREDEKIEFLKRDIEDPNYEYDDFENSEPSRVLEYLLDWPYQNYFMKTAEFMWDFLPERSYADLLLKICDKMNPIRGDLKYGEEKSYDYRKLLKEFWCQSPLHYKRYLFSDKEKNVLNYNETLNEGKELLFTLFTLNNFIYEDWKNIKLILDSATDDEKKSIIYSMEGKDICFWLLKEEKWEILDTFVSNLFPSKEKAEEFKREFSRAEGARRICVNFIKVHKWASAETFVKWSSLPEEEVMRYKIELAYSELGMNACMDLFLYADDETANSFCKWCLSSEEEVGKFKKELIFSVGVKSRLCLVINNKLDEFINWGLSSEEDIRELRKLLQ